jgi:hypothetical protein
MKKWICLSTVFFCLLFSCFGYAQKINIFEKPTFDAQTSLLFPFDGSVTAQTGDKKMPAVVGNAQFVPGRFGSAASFNPGGITLPQEYNPLLNHDRGMLEFFFKAQDKDWFYENHTFLTNSMKFCQPGYFSLWYWAGEQVLRLDFHLAGNCGFIVCALPKDTNWHHIAVGWNLENGYGLYMDGVLVAERKITWPGMWVAPEAHRRTGAYSAHRR